MPFSRLLIANRGEIACRVIRSARALGYATVAVYSEADADALHVRLADQAVAIGPSPAAASYLHIPALLQAAALAGADAVHPGYGFLSENAEFAEACAGAGLVFVGSPPSAIRAMGNKAAAKRLMREAGVPCVPGYDGPGQDDAALLAAAEGIGFPLMVKAAAGGGGRGMRLVESRAALAGALASARAEAMAAFGSDELILERAVQGARHVEIQVFADAHGGVLHLGERDCSIQRRHQKVIEEAPSPAVSADLRSAMGEAAVAAARAIGYRGAGTVEFLLARDGSFYFLEMNTRIQVEHPVTEAVTGLDLVAWQLKVAAGEPLPCRPEQIRFTGHAIEARVYAEDPAQDFLPQSGRLLAWEPPSGPGLRVDHGLLAGQPITDFYDPMLAKIIAHGASREEARRRLVAALSGLVLLGLRTNVRFLLGALQHPAFVAGETGTDFVERHLPPAARAGAADEMLAGDALAAVLLFQASAAPCEPLLAGWHSTGEASWPLLLDRDGRGRTPVSLACRDMRSFRVTLQDRTVTVELLALEGTAARIRIDGVERTARFAFAGEALHLALDGAAECYRDALFDPPAGADAPGEGELLAPMNGRVVAVLAGVGETVARGQRIVVLEAMKMQHEIAAGRDGIVGRVAVKPGDQVAARQLLVALEADA